MDEIDGIRVITDRAPPVKHRPQAPDPDPALTDDDERWFDGSLDVEAPREGVFVPVRSAPSAAPTRWVLAGLAALTAAAAFGAWLWLR